MRNSLLLAPMPTASTSQILGNNECFEPLTSNIYSRRTLAGEFVVTNKYLMRELINLGLWSNSVKNNIIQNKGSIQQITIIPEHIREKYKIVWEIPMKQVIQMAADRGHFICQSQSMNLWMEDPNYKTLTALHFFAWSKKLKLVSIILGGNLSINHNNLLLFLMKIQKKINNLSTIRTMMVKKSVNFVVRNYI